MVSAAGDFIDNDCGLKAEQLQHYNYLSNELGDIAKVS